MSNPLAELAKVGQSVWYDQMERKLITTGQLKKMIEQDDLRGMTSNPTTFEKAIAGSEDYDAQLRQLASENKVTDEIYDELVIKDIGDAAHLPPRLRSQQRQRRLHQHRSASHDRQRHQNDHFRG